MNRLEGIMMSLEYLVSNKKKRHIMGGGLLSASLLFAGLAFTIFTIRHEEQEKRGDNDEQYID